MKKYKHIVFDIDGTLLDTEQALLQSLHDTVMELLHEDMPESELKFALGIPGEVTLHRLGINDTLTANKKWNAYLLEYKSQIRLFTGIQDMLTSLKAERYSLGIVTSKTRNEFMTDFAESSGLSDYFDVVVCAEDSARPKPAPDPLLAYLATSGIDACDALYIGDTIYDSQCARSAEVDFGLVLWSNADSMAIPAKYSFKKPSDIPLLLKGGRPRLIP